MQMEFVKHTERAEGPKKVHEVNGMKRSAMALVGAPQEKVSMGALPCNVTLA